MFAELELSGRHNIRRDQSGLWHNTKVTMTTDGGLIQLPEYGEALDAGRQPGTKMVPLDMLIAWVKRYRILGRVKRTGVFRKASAESVNSAAVAIQRSIYRNGIKARPFIEATLDFQQLLIAEVVDQIMIPEIVSVLEVTFSDKN
ncbi:hypothetical protein [Solirubrum puertoriconensis]|nr:hypothetical protein [Solirubrum puertoriconensis]